MLNKPAPDSKRTIYHMKSVCGGGKSYAMLEHIRNNVDDRFIYAVPTLALARQIENDWAADGKQAGALVSINSTTSQTLLQDLEAVVANPFIRQTALITHELLFSDLFNPNCWIGEVIGDWHIVIDESPALIEEHLLPDSANAYPYLSDVVEGQCVPGKFTTINVVDHQRQRLADIVRGSDNDTRLDSSVRSLCKAIADDRLSTLLATPNGAGYFYYGAVFRAFADIVDRAGCVTILASSLAGFTQLYLQHYQIEVSPSSIKPRHDSYPIPLQKRINVQRVFKSGNMSIERLKEYGTGKLLDDIAAELGRTFLLRANESQHKEAKGRSYVSDIISKITNGLNAYIGETAFVDIASYNRNSILRNAYAEMDALLSVPPGTWEASLSDLHCELSAQAAFRIGIRDINFPGSADFTIVLPDARTEDYVREYYLPHAHYGGWIVDDGKTGKPTGRPTGKSSITAAKVAEAQRLVAEDGLSVSKACKAVGISRTTYGMHTSTS